MLAQAHSASGNLRRPMTPVTGKKEPHGYNNIETKYFPLVDGGHVLSSHSTSERVASRETVRTPSRH